MANEDDRVRIETGCNKSFGRSYLFHMEQRVPIAHIDAVTAEGSDEAERVVLHSRDGEKVYVRAADLCDTAPEPVLLYEGDELIMMEHISDVSFHTSPTGDEGYLLHVRVVPVRREEGKVHARFLAFGEPDDGRRVHLLPGEEFVLEQGSRIELDYVDEWEGAGVIGYVPLTPVLFTWMEMAAPSSETSVRYLLAAARRLDLAQALFQQVDEIRQSDPQGAPAVRRAIFALIGAVELAVVSLSRVMDMCVRASSTIGSAVPVPPEISSRAYLVKQIRNAYEHIEDRAMGTVFGRPDSDATTIFDHERIVRDGAVVYGAHRLDLATDVPQLIAAARQFLKDVAGE